MQTINKETRDYNGCTIFVQAIVQLTYDDLAAIIKRSGTKMFDGKMQDALAEHIGSDLGINRSHAVVVCRCWPDTGTELRTWNVEAIFVRNFQDVAFA